MGNTILLVHHKHDFQYVKFMSVFNEMPRNQHKIRCFLKENAILNKEGPSVTKV